MSLYIIYYIYIYILYYILYIIYILYYILYLYLFILYLYIIYYSLSLREYNYFHFQKILYRKREDSKERQQLPVWQVYAGVLRQ